MTRLEEARWLAQELYALVQALKEHDENYSSALVDDYLKNHDVAWINE
jgi:hypothetical protein